MLLTDLPWLPPAPSALRSIVRALPDGPSWEVAVRALATSRLNLTQLHTLAKAIVVAKAPEAGSWLKVAILSNGTTELLKPAVIATGPRHDLWLDISTGPFGAFMQEALDPGSGTNSRRNDFVVLALDHRAFNLSPSPGDPHRAEQTVDAAFDALARMVAGLRSASGSTVLVQTLPQSGESLFGSLDGHVPGTKTWLIDRFNQSLRRAPPAGSLLLDIAALAERVGLSHWHDPVQWNIGKFAFAHEAVPLYADWLCRVIAAAKGKAKKCLVLDLDNTLWGGVIGDDGMSGLVLGQGDPQGEAYLAVQAAALALRERGVVLAVSSKNEDRTARQVFREHPEMLLREEHIAVFQANWNDKAVNLKAIAETLNIGVDALVLLDDNPAERQQVRLALPNVAVPELPEGPEWFATILQAAGYFESIQFTAEDIQRAGQYQANSARAAALGASTDLQSYLESLEMEAHLSGFDDFGRPRIVQLINKTNQFNLTTRRYSESEVVDLERDPSAFTLQVRLKDKFGDNGMISVLICRAQDEDWLIDTWLMSCRVLNRKLEILMLNTLVACARQREVKRLIGVFHPTAKNGLVKDHYRHLGFQHLGNAGESSHWSLSVTDHSPVAVPIKATLGTNLLAN